MPPFVFEPIGIVRSPFTEKVSAPRQAAAAADVEGTIELHPGRNLEHALEDIETWERLWVVFVFDRVDGWRPKVLPPRSSKRRGVLATRSPHRPNPIGLSAVRLVGVDGLVLRIREMDILDGSPVLDLKPYVPYADAFPDAGSGWLETVADPIAPTQVSWSDEATARAAWLAGRGVDLAPAIEASLALGAQPNAYRRIRRLPDAAAGSTELELAVKEWRVRFRPLDENSKAVLVTSIHTGYRPRQLAAGEAPTLVSSGRSLVSSGRSLEVARAFVAAFGGGTG